MYIYARVFPAGAKVNKLERQTPNQFNTNQTDADVSIQLRLISTKYSHIFLLIYVRIYIRVYAHIQTCSIRRCSSTRKFSQLCKSFELCVKVASVKNKMAYVILG